MTWSSWIRRFGATDIQYSLYQFTQHGGRLIETCSYGLLLCAKHTTHQSLSGHNKKHCDDEGVCVHHNMKPQESTTLFVHVLSTSKHRSFHPHREGKTCQLRRSSEVQSIHARNRPEVGGQTFFVNVMHRRWSLFARHLAPGPRTQSRGALASVSGPASP